MTQSIPDLKQFGKAYIDAAQEVAKRAASQTKPVKASDLMKLSSFLLLCGKELLSASLLGRQIYYTDVASWRRKEKGPLIGALFGKVSFTYPELFKYLPEQFHLR